MTFHFFEVGSEQLRFYRITVQTSFLYSNQLPHISLLFFALSFLLSVICVKIGLNDYIFIQNNKIYGFEHATIKILTKMEAPK